MLSSMSRTWMVGSCMAATAAITTISIFAGAAASTTTLFLAVGLSTAALIVLISGNPKPTIAEILYQVEKDGRS